MILALRRELGKTAEAVRNRKGMAVQYAKAGIASTLMALTPVLIIVPYSIMKHQKISAKEVFGVFVTIAGVAMFFLL